VSLASLYRHPFITYTFVLSVVLAALLGIWLRLSGGRARVNPWLFIIPLEVPVLSYIINYVFVGKTCAAGPVYTGLFAGFPSFHVLCAINSRILGWVGPLSFLWLGFSIAFYWLRWYRSGRLIRGFSSLSVESPRVQAALARLCGDLGVRPPELCVMENSAPVLLTTGVFKKKIVLSTGTLDLLDEPELDASFAHELAHMRRGGHGLKWLFLLVRDVTMFSPASLWAYAGFYQEEEKACDDWVASRTSLGISLASSLVKFMKHGRKNTFTALMSHLLPDGNIGATRVRRLLGNAGNPGGRRAFRFLSPVLLNVLALGALLFIC
jgi:Zn-dependent protease with chaperone function